MMLKLMLTQVTSWEHLLPFFLERKEMMKKLEKEQQKLQKIKVKAVIKKRRVKTVKSHQRKKLKYQ